MSKRTDKKERAARAKKAAKAAAMKVPGFKSKYAIKKSLPYSARPNSPFHEVE